MTRLGKEIKKARIEKELSQQAVEALTGIPYRHLSAIERGDINPRWDTVVKLAMALDIHLDVVAWETDRETREVPHV
jgi:transcriptional regulator with XRE-family HTH domain